ncbi:UMP-CMP kinase [Nibea albiflora]|uniref:UMP-CMP kinase n=1 Tax=Nibea albiflora TaxID=240163 RepID=A0ACB7FHW1_NIBAL|nr:UMP-CMP kinase [Nibea albiflora]
MRYVMETTKLAVLRRYPQSHFTPSMCSVLSVNRIQTYLQSTRPIIDLYEKLGKVRTVDASRSVDEVYADVKIILDKEG